MDVGDAVASVARLGLGHEPRAARCRRPSRCRERWSAGRALPAPRRRCGATVDLDRAAAQSAICRGSGGRAWSCRCRSAHEPGPLAPSAEHHRGVLEQRAALDAVGDVGNGEHGGGHMEDLRESWQSSRPCPRRRLAGSPHLFSQIQGLSHGARTHLLDHQARRDAAQPSPARSSHVRGRRAQGGRGQAHPHDAARRPRASTPSTRTGRSSANWSSS